MRVSFFFQTVRGRGIRLLARRPCYGVHLLAEGVLFVPAGVRPLPFTDRIGNTVQPSDSDRSPGPPGQCDTDADAFWSMADHFRPYLKGVAANVIGARLANKVDASDVVQQGLAAAVDRLDQFRGQEAAQWQGWLVAIVRNEARNMVRYWRQDLRDAGREQALAAGSTVGFQPSDDLTSPGEKVEKREQAALLLSAVERLSPDHRRVIELRNFNGLDYAEIARQMGRSRDAVRQIWVRAVRDLRRSLEGQT